MSLIQTVDECHLRWWLVCAPSVVLLPLRPGKGRPYCSPVRRTEGNCIKNTIIEKFAGPYDRGEYSPSVQKTLYESQVLVLNRVPEVDEIEIVMPNQHYITIDMTKMGLSNKDEVLLPLDNPSGNITGTVRRKQQAKL